MGIKDYLKHIKQEYINETINYDHVYIDCNYLIHFLIYKCKNDKDLYYKTNNFFCDLLSAIKIKYSIKLIFDGEHDGDPETNPKFITHLIRYKNKYLSESISDSTNEDKPNSDELKYDKQEIKPGSKILNLFKYYLSDVIQKYKKINKLKFEIDINSDEIKGEADIKILDLIANSNQNNICICSKDSDMILIAHSLSINKSIKIDVITNFRPLQIVYVNKFKKFKLDYVLLVLLLGNDYLPKISNINYKSLIDTYETFIKYNQLIISNGKIDPNNLVEFINYYMMYGSKKKIKMQLDNFDIDRFNIYYNNLLWCLKYYKVVENDFNYIPYSKNNKDIKSKNTLNICNFIIGNYKL